MTDVRPSMLSRDGFGASRENKSKAMARVLKPLDTGSAARQPPNFRPPDLPLPTPSFSHGDFLARMQNTPIQSPISSPFRVAPLKLIESLVIDERTYLKELNVLQEVIKLQLLGQELDSFAAPVETLIDLSSELLGRLEEEANYFSDAKKDCLLHFSRVVAAAYEQYFEAFKHGVFVGISQSSERIQLINLLQSLNIAGQADHDIDWLLRRPLSRVRAYSTIYKKLLHSSDDATDMFLAYETFHGLLIEARETLEESRDQQNKAHEQLLFGRTAQRSVSGESTSTHSSSNSKISSVDELTGLQSSLNTSLCKDIFSLAPTDCKIDLLPRANDTNCRAIVNRENFHLQVEATSAGATTIDCMVELVLLTDQVLLIRPTFDGPRLLFPPLLRGVFHVSCIPSDPLKFEMDIVGRQTLRFVAATKESRSHWYELLLACEDFKLDAMPTVPRTLVEHVGKMDHQPWKPLATNHRLPPTPPHTVVTPTFGVTAPLRVIRENSQLSIAGYSDASKRTPEARDHPPFQFDLDDDATPRAVDTQNPLDKPLPIPLQENRNVANQSSAPQHGIDDSAHGIATSSSTESLKFPEPPARSGVTDSVPLTKSKSVDLFSPTSYTERFLRAPVLGPRSKTVQPPPSKQKDDTPTPPLKPLDLDFTQDEEFDETLLDLPTLPAFDFGDGVKRPSSVALNFSPNTMTNFGIPMRKVPAPTPMVLPDVAPVATASERTRVSNTIVQRRNGSEMSLSDPIAPIPPPKRDEIFTTMAECYSWENGTWTPILLDDVDERGRMKTVRSSRVTIFFAQPEHGSLEIFDKKDGKALQVLGVFASTSIIRDDPCDISVGFDVGSDKVYYMFRCETPDKANAMQHALNQAKFAAPSSGFVTPSLPMTPLWPEIENSAAMVESLKIKLYLFDNGKWANKGSARLTIRMIAQSRNRRITVTGKTRKNERIMLIDYIASPGDCDAISKTSISVRTKTETYMLQFKGGEKERGKILGYLVD